MHGDGDNVEYQGMSGAESMPEPPAMVSPARPSVPPWMAIVSIVIGSLGLLCWGSQAVSIFSAFADGVPAEELPEMSQTHQAFEIGGMIVAVVLGVWLIVGGIGGVGRRSWAPRVLQSWAVLRMIVAVIGLIVTFTYVDELVAMQQAAMESQIAKDAAEGEVESVPRLSDESLRAILLIFMGVVTLAVCIWPIFILSLVRKREVDVA